MERKTYSISYQTKARMAGALKTLMAQKPLEKIKIQEITDLCGMKRQHFYYHFENIYDLMNWMFQEEAFSLLEQREGVLLWQDGTLQLFQYLQDNKEVCLCAIRSTGREYLQRFFESDIYALIHNTVERLGEEIGYQKTDSPTDDIEMLTHFYVIALTGLMENWLTGKLDCSPEELVAFMDQVLTDQIRGAARRLQGDSGKSGN